jgi:hypothetical protein
VSKLIKNNYDCVFYNLGILGPIISKKCVKDGYKVLILENNKEFGIRNRVGNYLDNNTLEKLINNDVDQFIRAKTSEIIFFDEQNNEKKKENRDLNIIDKRFLERFMIKNVGALGVDIKCFSKIISIEEKNDFIESICIKSFKDIKNIKIGSLLSNCLIGKEYFNPEKTDSEPIISKQYEIYAQNLHKDIQFLIYEFETPSGLVMVFPSDKNRLYIWEIGMTEFKLSNFLRSYLKISNFTVLVIERCDFCKKTLIKNQYINHLLIGKDFGNINPLKSHYFMENIELGFFLIENFELLTKIMDQIKVDFKKYRKNIHPI